MTNCTGLAARTAARNAHRHRVCLGQFEQAQRSINRRRQCLALPKIHTATFVIDGDRTITVGEETHTRYSRLAPSHTIIILTSNGISQGSFSSSLLYSASAVAAAFSGCFNNACRPVQGIGFWALCGCVGPA